ncbi:hypothetical protein GCM10027093_61670 [Paraburkholderia jirisanensis]
MTYVVIPQEVEKEAEIASETSACLYDPRSQNINHGSLDVSGNLVRKSQICCVESGRKQELIEQMRKFFQFGETLADQYLSKQLSIRVGPVRPRAWRPGIV